MAPLPPPAREADDEDPGNRGQGPRQRRTRHRRQAPRGAARAGRAPVPRPPADRGRAGHRQDGPRQGDRPKPRLLVPPHPVHAGPAAVRRVRSLDLQPEDPGVRVPARAHLEPGRPRRRDQPRDAQDAVALLECMEERQATIDGITYPMPDPFLVIATQNPIEYEGTFALPEAQLDRFMLRIRLGYPAAHRGDRHPRRAEAHAPARGARGGPRSGGPADAAGGGPRDLRRLDGRRLHRPGRRRRRGTIPTSTSGRRRAARSRCTAPARRWPGCWVATTSSPTTSRPSPSPRWPTG